MVGTGRELRTTARTDCSIRDGRRPGFRRTSAAPRSARTRSYLGGIRRVCRAFSQWARPCCFAINVHEAVGPGRRGLLHETWEKGGIRWSISGQRTCCWRCPGRCLPRPKGATAVCCKIWQSLRWNRTSPGLLNRGKTVTPRRTNRRTSCFSISFSSVIR